jgi:glycyl-tRNA synthetase
MADTLSFQEIILKFLDYWKQKGCLVWHPHNVQVGAGTMNPATVLRVLGPEPWNVVYIEPGIRPDDGRFGDNPNRMQQHYQLQVILQPDPGNPQELYLDSLEAIGFDLNQHDIRFVEDNWQQPALGAWGLGWEVWLDGQEITQFTYFQQAGSVNLDPVAVEITYGLDRIALALQGVDSVWEIDFGAGIEYGDLLLQSEIEHCHYYFNQADVGSLKRVYDIYETEAYRCLEAELVAPAHDFNLKCSFIFNVLDTRGAIGVTERANYFGRMRRVARKIAEGYLDQRKRLEYPFIDNAQWQAPVAKEAKHPPKPKNYDTAQTFVLEIGCEELPSNDLSSALKQLAVSIPAMLSDLRLDYDRIEIQGTPRRLVALVHQLTPRQSDRVTEVKGPPADRAFDSDGNPTKAAIGFARSRGIKPSELKIIIEGDRRYAAAVVRETGQNTIEVLAGEVSGIIAGLKFEKSMRWNSSNVAFSRPVRWLLALYGQDVISFEFGGMQSGRLSRGLRGSKSPTFEIANADDYQDALAEQRIILAPQERRATIQTAVRKLAAEAGGKAADDPRLLAEVVNLVEMPTLLLGNFDSRFLSLPVEVLVAVMKKHQRYFPVYDESKEGLMPHFITVRNGGSEYIDTVRDGNEHVIEARFKDAEFFYMKDSQYQLSDFLPRLETLTFQSELGSMLDKVHRLQNLTPIVADMVGLSTEEKESASRAAALSKADLASSLVVEMTSLQGIMGGHYAARSGESQPVSDAIAEQYEAVSRTGPGLALALADRIDSLLGLFAAGLAPKGSNDPFALRRAAIQIIENLVSNEISLDLGSAMTEASSLMPVEVLEEDVSSVLRFIGDRLKTYLHESGIRTSIVRAIVNEQGHNPYPAHVAANSLNELVETEEWSALLDSYARCVRITRDQPQYDLDQAKLTLPAERELYEILEEALKLGDGTVDGLVAQIRRLEPAITGFFDNVLVMDDDRAIRDNRLALLQNIAAISKGIADLSQLEGF